MSEGEGEGAGAGVGTPGDDTPNGEAQRVVGAFISAVGIGIMVLALAGLRETWSTAQPGPLVLLAIAVAAMAAAVWIFFERVNPQPMGGRRPAGGWRGWILRAAAAQVGALLLLGSAFAVWGLISSGETDVRYDQFVMQIPSLPETAESEAEAGKPRDAATPVGEKARLAIVQVDADPPPPSQAEAAATAPSPPVLISWSVEQSGWKPPKGTLPTFLGALFAIGFGVWFPHLGLTKAKSATEFVGKLVAPVLSLGLLGVGATQSVESAKIQADTKLAEKGLPTYISLPNDLRDEARGQVVLVNAGNISPAAMKLVDERLTALQVQVQDLIDHPVPGPPGPPGKDAAASPVASLTPEELKALGKEIGAFHGSLRTEAAANRKLTSAEFEELRKSLHTLKAEPMKPIEQVCQQVALRHATLVEPQEVKDVAVKPKPRNGGQKMLDWLTGKPPPVDNSEEIARQGELRARWLDSKRQADYCAKELASGSKQAASPQASGVGGR